MSRKPGSKPDTEACLICGSDRSRMALSVDQFALRICRGCGLWTLGPRIAASGGDDYESALDLDIYVSYMRPFRTTQYRQELAVIRRLSRGNELIDIGCGAGWYLTEANRLGFRADGVEPQKALADLAMKENPRSRILVGEMDGAPVPEGRYDCVSMWSVFEHMNDPLETARDVHRMLRPGGVFAIRTPNSRSLLEMMSVWLHRLSFGRVKWPLAVILQLEFESKHWYLFSRSNLTRLLDRAGFRIGHYYYSTSIDWRNLDLWYRARRLKLSPVWVQGFKMAFAANEALSRALRRRDDLVFFAVKR